MFKTKLAQLIPLRTDYSYAFGKSFSISAVNFGIKWRRANGMPDNPTSRGVLTDGPDFSFMDGKPTPFTTGQRARILRQREHAERVKKYLIIIQNCKKTYNEKIAAEQRQKEEILGRKLRPKGRLLKKNTL